MIETIAAVLVGLGMAAAVLMSAEAFTTLFISVRDSYRVAVYGA